MESGWFRFIEVKYGVSCLMDSHLYQWNLVCTELSVQLCLHPTWEGPSTQSMLLLDTLTDSVDRSLPGQLTSLVPTITGIEWRGLSHVLPAFHSSYRRDSHHVYQDPSDHRALVYTFHFSKSSPVYFDLSSYRWTHTSQCCTSICGDSE